MRIRKTAKTARVHTPYMQPYHHQSGRLTKQLRRVTDFGLHLRQSSKCGFNARNTLHSTLCAALYYRTHMVAVNALLSVHPNTVDGPQLPFSPVSRLPASTFPITRHKRAYWYTRQTAAIIRI